MDVRLKEFKMIDEENEVNIVYDKFKVEEELDEDIGDEKKN